MKKTMILLLAATLLVGTTGCNSPGTASTDTSVVSDDGGSTASENISSTLSMTGTSQSTSSTNTKSAANSLQNATPSSVKASSRTSSTKSAASQTSSTEPLVIPPKLQKIWDSLTDTITEDEKNSYQKFMKQKGLHTEGVSEQDLYKVLYGFDEVPYYVLARANDGYAIFYRVGPRSLLYKSSDTNSDIQYKQYLKEYDRVYYCGPGETYLKNKDGNFTHRVTKVTLTRQKALGWAEYQNKKFLLKFYEE